MPEETTKVVTTNKNTRLEAIVCSNDFSRYPPVRSNDFSRYPPVRSNDFSRYPLSAHLPFKLRHRTPQPPFEIILLSGGGILNGDDIVSGGTG